MDDVLFLSYSPSHRTYNNNMATTIACYFNKTGASGYIRSTEIPTEVYNYYLTYDTPIECIWNITVQPEWQVCNPASDFLSLFIILDIFVLVKMTTPNV